jgi:hypothetical protein
MASIFDNMNQEIEENPHAPSKEFVNNRFYTPILKKDGTELSLWKPALGPNYIDLIPFRMATDKWDKVDVNDAKKINRNKGKIVYDIVVDVNMRLTQGNTSWDYPSRSFLGLGDDAIAEEKWRLFNKAKDDFGITGTSPQADKDNCSVFQQAKKLFPSTRSLYIVAVYNAEIVQYNRDAQKFNNNPANTDKKKLKKNEREFHLFAPAYHTFGRLLEEKKSDEMKIGNDINWGHPTQGPTIFIDGRPDSWKDSTGTSRPMVAYKSIAIMPRLEAYPESIIDKVPSLDEHIIVPTADEVYKALFGVLPSSTVKEEVEEEGLSFKKAMSAPVTVEETFTEDDDASSYEDEDTDDSGSFEDDIPF